MARNDVSFILKHNHKVVKQYRRAQNKSQQIKRVAQVCGQKFVDHAVEVECEHEGLKLTGWIAKPSFYRQQNDLCYSYVNGRMMRDKLINHAIRQAYADMLPSDSYPAFVLFLSLNFEDVDVNVHPAKHEVRFHQGRYVHDFIFSVCHKALLENQPQFAEVEQSEEYFQQQTESSFEYAQPTLTNSDEVRETSYIQPLRPGSHNYSPQANYQVNRPSILAKQAYSELMTPVESDIKSDFDVPRKASYSSEQVQFLAPKFVVITIKEELRLLSLSKLALQVNKQQIEEKWLTGIVSQPLLLPVKLNLPDVAYQTFVRYRENLQTIGIHTNTIKPTQIQVRQFPALLRKKDVSSSLLLILDELEKLTKEQELTDEVLKTLLSRLILPESYSKESAKQLIQEAENIFQQQFEATLLLNSVVIDLTSEINQLSLNQ